MASEGKSTGPLYSRVMVELRTLIARNEYEAGQLFITQREVCERYGVSMTTAVRALNALVAEGLLVRRQGVGTFVADRDPGAATPTRTDDPATPTLTCILHGHGPHQTQILMGAEAVCTRHHYRLVYVNSNAAARDEAAALRRAISDGTSGVILYPVDTGTDLQALAEVEQAGIPVVLIDRYLREHPTDVVEPDHFDIGYRLTAELIRLGHTRIATLWSETRCTSVLDRLSGHLQALREYGLPILSEFTAMRDFEHQTERDRQAQLRRWRSGAHPPTVLLCSNGYVLAAAVHDLAALGATVPDDIDVASMDTAGPFDLLPLAAVAANVPSAELGGQAAQLLHEQITVPDRDRQPQHIVQPVTIISRADSRGYLRAYPARP